MIEIKETTLNDEIIDKLIELSRKWYEEDITYGYKVNELSDLIDKKIFIISEESDIIGYLTGYYYLSETMNSLIDNGTNCFEVDEFYIQKDKRNKGLGSKLFKYMEDNVDADCISLSSANKNYVPLLHLYVDELEMKPHSIRLFKKK